MAWVHLATAPQNAAMDAVADLIDGGAAAGIIEIYANDGDGTPANANVAVTNQTKLATLTFSDPAFGDAAAGVVTANAITSDASADATGVAAWARILDSDSNVIMDVDVSTSGATINFSTTSFVAGDSIAITSMTLTMPSGV